MAEQAVHHKTELEAILADTPSVENVTAWVSNWLLYWHERVRALHSLDDRQAAMADYLFTNLRRELEEINRGGDL